MKIDIDVTAGQTYQIFALADTWMAERALQMAYESYLENSKDERAALKKQNLARWEDFRTYQGIGASTTDPSMYQGTNEVPLTDGEFILTKAYDKTGTERFYTWSSTLPDRYGILSEYTKAGNAQTSPDTSTGDMPYDDLMADNDADMAADLQTDGNLPPYDATRS